MICVVLNLLPTILLMRAGEITVCQNARHARNQKRIANAARK
ncbi:MAG: hypothetical protein G01um101470_308 [Parcubacteria group bacterium Gr01-1014_70]|nr:MAG: hypothetical protein G01um101470_308 [Parcubacteria group bacterium Gr01-1014_70]